MRTVSVQARESDGSGPRCKQQQEDDSDREADAAGNQAGDGVKIFVIS